MIDHANEHNDRRHRVVTLRSDEAAWLNDSQPCLDCGHLVQFHASGSTWCMCHVPGCPCLERDTQQEKRIARAEKQQAKNERTSRRTLAGTLFMLGLLTGFGISYVWLCLAGK